MPPAPHTSPKGLSVAKPELGSKHKCQNCGTKFFDLNKDPVVCPKCGEVQTMTAMPSPVRATRAAPAAAVNRNTDDDEADTESGAEVMSLEDADQPEDGQVVAAGTEDEADIEADDDAATADDDDTFLEEEEDDDSNVSDLIDGDIENDEER